MFIIDHIISKINQVGVVISQEVLIRVFHPAEWFYFPLPSASNSGSRIPYNMEQEKTNKKMQILGKTTLHSQGNYISVETLNY